MSAIHLPEPSKSLADPLSAEVELIRAEIAKINQLYKRVKFNADAKRLIDLLQTQEVYAPVHLADDFTLLDGYCRVEGTHRAKRETILAFVHRDIKSPAQKLAFFLNAEMKSKRGGDETLASVLTHCKEYGGDPVALMKSFNYSDSTLSRTRQLVSLDPQALDIMLSKGVSPIAVQFLYDLPPEKQISLLREGTKEGKRKWTKNDYAAAAGKLRAKKKIKKDERIPHDEGEVTILAPGEMSVEAMKACIAKIVKRLDDALNQKPSKISSPGTKAIVTRALLQAVSQEHKVDQDTPPQT